MAALVLTALSISPVLKDVDQSKYNKNTVLPKIIWFIVFLRSTPEIILTLARELLFDF